MRVDKKYLKIAIYAFIVLAAVVVFQKWLNEQDVQNAVGQFLVSLWRTISPIVAGLVIAYLLNPVVKYIENVFMRIKTRKMINKRLVRGLSITTTFLIFVGILLGTVSYLVPLVYRNMEELFRKLPNYFAQIEGWLVNLPLIQFKEMPDLKKWLEDILQNISGQASESVLGAVEFTWLVLTGFVGGVLNFLLGLILSIYVLADKEKLSQTAMRALTLWTKPEKKQKWITFFQDAHRVFGNFFSAKILEACLIGAGSWVIFYLFGVPYAVLFGLLSGMLSLVPYFGPLIAAVISIGLTYFAVPEKVFTVALISIIVQLVDGWFLAPKIFKDKMGLNPFWSLLGVMLGSALFGLWGIVLGVPLMALARIYFQRLLSDKKESKLSS